MQEYDHKQIEQKWRKIWEENQTYKTKDGGKKQYILDMFPYPSGEGLHVGHPRGYVATDVYSRMKRMQGFNVLHPMGWDAFGLPAENYAIKNKVHPRVAVERNVARYKEQLSIIGFDYDWSREINTTDPVFYKWTQWIFLQMYKKGLAYESNEPINWCPSCQTGLANEDVEEDGTCERCGTKVELKPMRQWVLKITAYADRMLADLDKLPAWPNGVKEAQRHWIGRTENPDGTVSYNMRDWVFSRQRYWGEPIPIIHCDKCAHSNPSGRGVVPVPEKDLPVVLPEVDSYAPTGTGESPLADIAEWVNVPCPTCGSDAKRETNTMPQWAGSSWYYLRYIDPTNTDALIDSSKEKEWMPVDVYVGGDHATRHLIYARFWHKFLFDIGVVSTEEPFPRLEFLGFILAEDGRKMSKRWGNVVNPDEMVERFGADAFRLYEMFIGPFENTVAWSTNGLVGTYRFLERVLRLKSKIDIEKKICKTDALVHKTIKGVSDDIEAFKFNTAVSKMMILLNALEKEDAIVENSYKMFLQILAPFAPHFTEEIWSDLGNESSIHLSTWPAHNTSLLIDEDMTIVIQINSKLRGEMVFPRETSEEVIKEAALNNPKIIERLAGTTPKRVIYIEGKLVNIVI